MHSLLDIPQDRRAQLSYRTSCLDTTLQTPSKLRLPKDKTSNCLYGNILKSNNSGYIGIRIPRNNDYYTGTDISARKIKRYLGLLEEQGLIRQYSGGFDYHEGERNDYCSVILFELTFRESLKVINIKEYTDVIHIRNRENKERKSNRGVHSIKQLSEHIIMLNKLMLSTEYRLDDNKLPVQQFKRVFSDSLDLGGRFYTIDGGIQTMPSAMRRGITVNGLATIELDYKAMHPSIILELKNRESIVDFKDPYGFIVDEIDRKGVPFSIVRDYYKLALIIAINCKSFKSAEAALRKAYNETPRFHVIGEHYAGNVLRAAYEHNTQLQEYFFADMGVFLQNVDSQIMNALLIETTKRNIPVYPIHDSVMVSEKDSYQVTVLMKQAYEEVLGGTKFCFIETKR